MKSKTETPEHSIIEMHTHRFSNAGDQFRAQFVTEQKCLARENPFTSIKITFLNM